MKPGIATISLRKYDVFHALDLAAEVGFMGVEIWGRPPHTPEEFDEQHTRQIRKRLQANGLEAAVIGSYANPALPDFARKAADAIRIASILGARIIRVWAGNKEPHEAGEELWSLVAKSFYEFALQAELSGITLAMEMHGGTLCATPQGALRVIREAEAPNLKLNFQVNDMANPDLDNLIGAVGDYVVNVHAQNYRPSCLEKGKMDLSWIREGVVDYDKALSLLKSHGFNGYVEAEFLKGEFVSEDALMESLRKDAEYLRQLTAKYSG